MTSDPAQPAGRKGNHLPNRPLRTHATFRVIVSVVVGAAVGFTVGRFQDWPVAWLVGWMAAAAVLVAWVWLVIWPMDAEATARHAGQEDAGRAVADLVVVAAAVTSLAAVALLLSLNAGTRADSSAKSALSLGSVALAWLAVHTTFTTRYARLYYTGAAVGGVDFNEDSEPAYTDFAYLALTIGMTFQVSDTALQSKDIRRTVLRHALLSYLFSVVIIAATINLIAGLGA